MRYIPRAILALSSADPFHKRIQLVGFGTFEVKERTERIGRNPQTKESITIPASKFPSFIAGKALKDAVK
ncbi:MAG: HU family DNA-binding protein [Desulfosporosinus sp.]|nr:HU family DNA-binding protein [Desulfosporosinus sp.]